MAMTDAEHKSKSLKVPEITVLTDWRLDKQQLGKVNSKGRKKQFYIFGLFD